MAKTNLSVQPGSNQLDSLQDLAQPQLPVGTPEQEQAPSAPAGGGLINELAAEAPQIEAAAPETLEEAPVASPELQQDISDGFSAALTGEQPAPSNEDGRFDIQPAGDRYRDTSRVDRWKPVSKAETSANSIDANGGIFNRANNMASNVHTGKIYPGVTVPKNKFENLTGQENAEVIRENNAKEGSLAAAIHSVGAVEAVPNPTNPARFLQVPNKQFLALASTIVEDMFAQSAFGEGDYTQDQIELQQQGIDPAERTVFTPQQRKVEPIVSKSKNNGVVGKRVLQEYLRTSGGDATQPINKAEAETVGDAMKEMWAASAGPNIVQRIPLPDGQVAFQLTPEGVESLQKGTQARARMFPKVNVRPAKSAPPKGKLPGDVGATAVKNASSRVGKVEFGEVLEDATKNLSEVPNVVDKTRSKVLYSTILGVLSDEVNPYGPEGWKASIVGLGRDKIDAFQAKAAAEQRTLEEGQTPTINPDQMLYALKDKVAQEVRAVAQESQGVNYLTYSTQAFNGRIQPQQSFFDPTTSKVVRFVTRNVVPSVAVKGGRVDRNLRQMYATQILPAFSKGADALLPRARDQMLDLKSSQMAEWGNRLKAAMSMTDAQLEAVTKAIEAGTPVNDPNFPKVQGLQLDPTADADIIKAIEGMGEDGMIFIEGLMDFTDYKAARDAGKPHSSYFNGYIDGKTNGIAANGVQMGHIGTAEKTGIVRNSSENLLDNGDIRDELASIATSSIDNGWDGNTEGYLSELNDVARAVYNHRQLNKDTTMTFGYGKEIDSFVENFTETIDLLSAMETNGKDSKTLDPDPKNWDKDTKNEYMQWQKSIIKEDSTFPGYSPEVLFHSSPQNNLNADTFRYRPVNVPNKAASGKGDGIFTHGYDADGTKFGGNVYAVIYDKTKPTYAGKEDTTATAIDEIFIPKQAVGEVTRIWPPAGEVINNFQAHRKPKGESDNASTFNESLKVLDDRLGRTVLAETLLGKYKTALIEVLSPEAIAARKLLRSAAIMNSMYNKPMTLKTYTGMEQVLGAQENVGFSSTSYKLNKAGEKAQEVSAGHYDQKVTAAAGRNRTDIDGNAQIDYGGYTYGGSIPGPVQSLDAATVAMSASGKSWEKLKKASGGNPYMHTIYDAFKMDANGYDVMLEEVNKNWMEASMEWSYLKETRDSTLANREQFRKEILARNNEDVLGDQESQYIRQMTTLVPNAFDPGARPTMNNLAKKIKASIEPRAGQTEKDFKKEVNFKVSLLENELAKHGYDSDGTADEQILKVKHLKIFNKRVEEMLNYVPQVNAMIKQTEANKKELRKELLKRGHQLPNGEKIALQYYAH